MFAIFKLHFNTTNPPWHTFILWGNLKPVQNLFLKENIKTWTQLDCGWETGQKLVCSEFKIFFIGVNTIIQTGFNVSGLCKLFISKSANHIFSIGNTKKLKMYLVIALEKLDPRRSCENCYQLKLSWNKLHLHFVYSCWNIKNLEK